MRAPGAAPKESASSFASQCANMLRIEVVALARVSRICGVPSRDVHNTKRDLVVIALCFTHVMSGFARRQALNSTSITQQGVDA